METTRIDPDRTVADLVLDHSECANVLQRHRIDFCCKGGVSIADAATARGLDPAALLAELTQAIEDRRGAPATDPRALSTTRLVEHVVDRHHAYLRKVLPFVRGLATKVARVHGGTNPRLLDLHDAVEELAEALLIHLEEEERVLFPAMTSTDADPEALTTSLTAMQDDHLAVAELLARIRAATEDFTLPDWACGSYRALFSELADLERDTFTHVHLENHVLAPRFARS